MATDYAEHNIRVNYVMLAMLFKSSDTWIFRKTCDEQRRGASGLCLLRRAGQPDEIATVIMFLASSDASYVTGSVVSVDGGFTAGKNISLTSK